jgi:cleavage and polyadenylation specificity factor subunit 3
VGRSCVVLRFKGRTIMVRRALGTVLQALAHHPAPQLDCGTHPAYKGLGALPFFDVIEPDEIDLVLVSQCVRAAPCCTARAVHICHTH